jgi:proteic killer suppression protein
VNVEFSDDDLDELETDGRRDGGYSPGVVKAFRKKMQLLRAARDERDLRAMKGARFEQLKGKRSHQHSIRLNDQWRLVLELRGTGSETVVVVCDIEDYH